MKRSVLLLVRLYVAFSILQPLLLSVFLKPIHFFGAASLTYLFQFSLGNGKGTLSYLSLILMGVLFAGMVISYIFVEREKQIMPFPLVVGADVVISLGIIIYKITIHNYLDMLLLVIGCGIRLLFFLYLVHNQHLSRKSNQ